MFDDAGRYLARVVPWDGTHWINVHQKYRAGLPGKAFLSVHDAIDNLKYFQRRSQLDDLYVSMGSAIAFDTKKAKVGPYNVAFRDNQNVYGLKSLWLDIDVKAGGYADTQAAQAALTDFCAAISLPLPNVLVASGTGGVHAYWTFEPLISTEDWLVRAHALVAAIKAHGVHCDTGCSIDNVRLLRIPDTFNAKQTPHLPVTLLKCEDDGTLAALDAALQPYFNLKATPKSKSKSKDDNIANGCDYNELSGGIVAAKAAKRIAADVAQVCPAFRHSLETNGRDDREPRWHLMMGLAYYCEEGETLAHELSSAHPGYHPEETQIQYERIVKDRDEKPSIGWTKCRTMSSNDCPECDTCPLLSAGLSPLHHAKPSPSIEAADFPSPFFRAKDTGYVYRRGADGEADDLVARYNVFDGCVSVSPWVLHFKFNVGGAGTQDVRLPFGDISSDQAFKRTLGDQGFVVSTRWAKDFMAAFMSQLQERKETVASAQSFGWHTDGGEVDGFIYAGTRFTAEGNKRAVKPEEALYQIYTPIGSGDYWRELASIINAQQRPALDMLLTAAFAAPLIRFTGQKGFVVGGWSPGSGLGKTTTLMAASAVWGSPKKGLSGNTDTENHAMGRIGRIRNLPLLWDEIVEDEDRIRFARVAFALTRGTEKGRMRKDIKLGEQGDWETSVTYASNASVLEAVLDLNKTTIAGSMRIFEVRVPDPVVAADPARIDALVERLTDNYGWAGRIYAEFLGANVAKIRNDVQSLQTAISKILARTQDERFWIAHITTQILGASYANKLGLTQIDIPALREFLFAEFRRMSSEKRVAVNDLSRPESVEAILADFLREKRARNTVFTDVVWLNKWRPTKGAVKLLYEGRESERMEALHVHVGVQLKIIRISEVGLSEWLKRKHIARLAFIEAMKDSYGARRVTGGVIGGGTRFAVGQASEPLWELPLAGTPLGDVIDWSAPTDEDYNDGA